MHIYGIHHDIIEWTHSFLFNRTFKVRVADLQSALVPACSGVAHASVLAPTWRTDGQCSTVCRRCQVNINSLTVRRPPLESSNCIPMVEAMWPATECCKMFTRLHRRTSPFPSDSNRRNGNFLSWLYVWSRCDFDVYPEDINPLSAGG